MKRISTLFAIAALLSFTVFMSNNTFAQTSQHGTGFVDENGDGYNDNAPDHDNDGIPNGQDADYEAAGVQSGKKADKGFVDENGDGVNDNAADDDADGIPNGQDSDYVKPEAGLGQQSGKGAKGGQAQQNQGVKGFIDEDGDGFNDNAPDVDGDGIPNGQDEDFVRAESGKRFGRSNGQAGHGFVDEDGDGFNDNAPDADGDGTPNGQDADWSRPEDCLGRGAKFNGRGMNDAKGSAVGEENDGSSSRKGLSRGGRG